MTFNSDFLYFIGPIQINAGNSFDFGGGDGCDRLLVEGGSDFDFRPIGNNFFGLEAVVFWLG